MTRTEHMRAYNARRLRLAPGEMGFREVVYTYKHQAERRGLRFTLTTDILRILTRSRCYYCGAPPSQVKQPRSKTFTAATREAARYVYNGIDRLDSDRGYEDGNIVPCCGTCNAMKSKLPFLTFLNHIKRIAKHLNLE